MRQGRKSWEVGRRTGNIQAWWWYHWWSFGEWDGVLLHAIWIGPLLGVLVLGIAFLVSR